MNYWQQSKENIYVAAHRGWSTKYPENTMLAFRKAIEVGVDQLEIDVRVTKDNQLVIIHDATVDRTTNGTGNVCDLTLAELKALDAGSHKGAEFAGEQIPTLTEFMELVKDHPTMTLDVELKEYPTKEGWEAIAYDVCDRVLKLLEDYGYAERTVINTWSGMLHSYIRNTYGSKVKRHVYYPARLMGTKLEAPFGGAYCCCMFAQEPVPGRCNIATPEEFRWMKEQGVQPWAGAGVKDEATVDMAIACGAELITCNNPDVILELLRKKGFHK